MWVGVRSGARSNQSAQGKVDDDDVVWYAIRDWRRRPETLTLFTFHKAIIFRSHPPNTCFPLHTYVRSVVRNKSNILHVDEQQEH